MSFRILLFAIFFGGPITVNSASALEILFQDGHLTTDAYAVSGSLKNSQEMEADYHPARLTMSGSENFRTALLGANLPVATSASSAFQSTWNSFSLNPAGDGFFSSESSYHLSGERRTGRFTSDGGYGETSFTGAYEIGFYLSEPATMKISTGYLEYSAHDSTSGIANPKITIANQEIPLYTPANSYHTVTLNAFTNYTFRIDAPWGGGNLGLYVPSNGLVEGFASLGVRWTFDEALPGTQFGTPIKMHNYEDESGSRFEETLSEEPVMVVGSYLTSPELTGIITTPTADGVDSVLYFQSPVDPDNGLSLGHLIGTLSNTITALALPAEYGEATLFNLEFGDQSYVVGLGETFNFLDVLETGVESFRLIPSDGAVLDQFTFGLQFSEGTVATIFTAALVPTAVPEPTSGTLALSAVFGLWWLRRRRK